MNRVITKISISVDGIDVISDINGAKNITQINFNGTQDELIKIMEKYNIDETTIFEYNERIIRALALDAEGVQLKEYLEICRRTKNGEKDIDLVKNMPEIEYDLRS